MYDLCDKCTQGLRKDEARRLRYDPENRDIGQAVNQWTLVLAAESGHIECVKFLTMRGAVVSAGAHGALGRAAMGGHLECVRFLVKSGASVDTEVLNSAAGGGNLECVKYLISSGAVVNAKTLTCAARGGHLECVKLLIAGGAVVEAEALNLAAKGKHIECVIFLIASGADVHAEDHYGRTALSYAFEAGSPSDCAQLLLDIGANVGNSVNELLCAVESESREYLQMVIDNGVDVNALCRGDTALIRAAMYGHEETVQLLLDSGADPDIRTHGRCGSVGLSISPFEVPDQDLDDVYDRDRGLTALMGASYCGSLGCVQRLLSKGANPLLVSSCGLTALRLAESMEIRELTALRLAASKEIRELTALRLATAKEIRELLAEAVERWSSAPRALDSEFMRVVQIDSCRRVETLIKCGPDVNQRDFNNGETPLMKATLAGCLECMRRLLDFGADVNARANWWEGEDESPSDFPPLELSDIFDDRGWTALMYAAARGRGECVELLLSRGASPRMLSWHGYSAKQLVNIVFDYDRDSSAIEYMLDLADAQWELSLTVNRVARGDMARRRVRAMRVADLLGLGESVEAQRLPGEVWRLIGEMAYSRGRPGSSGPGRARVLQLRLLLREPFAPCVTCGACAGAPQCAPCRVKGVPYACRWGQ